MRTIKQFTATIALATMPFATGLLHAEIPVKTGDKVAFLGDSITKFGQNAPGGYLTVDGVHMALAGNLMMATGVLKGFGLNAGEIGKAMDAWLDIPNVSKLSATTGVTMRQADQLEKLAVRRKVSVDSLLDEQFNKSVESLLKTEAR